MKIVIINGSARKGNTLAAINAFIKGASEKNKIEIIEPDKLNIAPCKGCGVCQCSKGCVDKDDTNPTIDKIAAADMILFATPVYWWGMSAQLKLVIDKCYCRGLQLKNKNALIQSCFFVGKSFALHVVVLHGIFLIVFRRSRNILIGNCFLESIIRLFRTARNSSSSQIL